MDPSPDDLGGLSTVQKIWDYAKVPEPLVGKINQALGEITEISDLVLIPSVEFSSSISGIPEISVVQKARIMFARRVARLKLNLPAEEAKEKVEPSTSSGPAASAPINGRKIKVNSVLDQSCEAEITPLDPAAIRRMFDSYVESRGDEPHPDIEPSADQISAFKQILGEDAVPFVDFAVFGPHGQRLQKKLTFRAFTHQPDGSWRKIELPGPPDFNTWWRCFRTYKCLLLLFGVVQVERIDNYGEFIRDLCENSDPSCWWIINQADSRMRSEEFERIRRRLEADHAKFTAAGLHVLSNFDSNRPWDSVFKHAVSDTSKTFWDKEVREKTMQFKLALKTGAEIADDGTAQPKLLSSAVPLATPGVADGGEILRQGIRRQTQSQRKELPDNSVKGPDGQFTSNKKGKWICLKFNKGECKSPCPNKRVHQCSICLRNDHPASNCPQASTRESGKGSKGKGKGK